MEKGSPIITSTRKIIRAQFLPAEILLTRNKKTPKNARANNKAMINGTPETSWATRIPDVINPIAIVIQIRRTAVTTSVGRAITVGSVVGSIYELLVSVGNGRPANRLVDGLIAVPPSLRNKPDHSGQDKEST